jgi:hypothetical protein
MLETMAITLIVLWLLGLVSSYALGGLSHVLLIIVGPVVLVCPCRTARPRDVGAFLQEETR